MPMTITQELRLFLDYSFSQMEHLKQTGAISDRLFRHYVSLWLWGTWRDSYAHTSYYARMGSAAYWRRIDRVQALIARIRAVPLPEPGHIPFAVGRINP